MRRRRFKYWLLNVIAGLVVLLLGGMHLAIFHLDDVLAPLLGISTEPLAWAEVRARGTRVGQVAAYVLLLAAALFHGFYGLRTVLTEIWDGRRATVAIGIVCWVLGLSLFAVGTFGAIYFHGVS